MMQPMTVKFWGVRGSVPSPGPATARYGGNTSCVSVHLGDDKILVLDAGTGIRELGKTLLTDNADIFVLVTHVHWDHIQGFPFFPPIYRKDRTIYLFPFQQGETVFNPLLTQMDGTYFPVNLNDLPSKIRVITGDIGTFMRRHGFDVSRTEANHPGGAYGYRIESKGRGLVYLTDNELVPAHEKNVDFQSFVRFCSNTDVLIHDAQYIEQDMPQKFGWGHSSVRQACQLAVEAGVKHLVLHHHDPDRTDDQIDMIQEEAAAWFRKNGPHIRCTAAYEGLEISI